MSVVEDYIEANSILIVDDEDIGRETLETLLGDQGYHLILASEGMEALTKARECLPDVVLLDIVMPGVDGYEVCRIMRSDPILAEVPIIMITSLDDQASRLKGLALGADDFLTKPFDWIELRARIHTVCRLNRYRHLLKAREQRLQALEALQESEIRYRDLFNNVNDMIQSVAPGGRLLSVNRAWLKNLGYAWPEVQGRKITDFLHPSSFHVWEEALSAASNLQANSNVMVTFVTRNGRNLECEGQMSSQTVGEDTLSIQTIFRDLTERRRQEELLRQNHKMEALGTLAGGIAHDFNNILTALIGYTEMGHDLSEDRRIKDYLSRVLQAADRGKDLVEQLLTYSRKTEVEHRPLDLCPVLRDAIALLRAAVPASMRIELDLPDTSLTILADATQIHQIIMNLGTNAYQAMQGSGGTFSISCRTLDGHDMGNNGLAHLKSGPYVCLSLKDDGCGIGNEILSKIFDPFFTTKSLGEGTGMGLAVVHSIVTKSGGSIQVRSRPGNGTEFLIHLPLIESQVNTDVPTGSDPQQTTGRILCIDDEQTIVEMMREMLETMGYDVFATATPAEAIARFQQYPELFDLIITDHIMPQQSGLELARCLRTVRRDIPMILSSGNTDLIDIDEAADSGICDFLQKPFTMKSLEKVISRQLSPYDEDL